MTDQSSNPAAAPSVSPHAATIFHYDVARAQCAKSGLTFDDGLMAAADTCFARNNLTQTQVDSLMLFYCRVQAITFDRTIYQWKVRLKAALYWIGLGKRVNSDV